MNLINQLRIMNPKASNDIVWKAIEAGEKRPRITEELRDLIPVKLAVATSKVSLSSWAAERGLIHFKVNKLLYRKTQKVDGDVIKVLNALKINLLDYYG